MDSETFGGLLREWRAAAGFTQEQLAEHAGLGVRTIRDLERGRVRRPHRETIRLLATALGLPAAARDEPVPSDLAAGRLAAGRLAARANALNTIGWNSAMLGEYQQALPYCQQALGLLRDLGDRSGEAATLDSLGYIYRRLGDYQHALDHHRQALRLFSELGDRYKQTESQTGLGDTYQAAGNPQAAWECWQRSLAIRTDLGHPRRDR